MRFAKFDDAWLNYACAPMSMKSGMATAGKSFTQNVTITSQEGNPIAGASLTLDVPEGWTASTVAVPNIAYGGTVTVPVVVTVPINAVGGSTKFNAVLSLADGRNSIAEGKVNVITPTTYAIGGVLIAGTRTDSTRNLDTNPYAVGEVVTYSYSMTNTNSVEISESPISGNWDANFLPPTANNCRFRSLAPGQTFTCPWAKRTLTQDDINMGYFLPTAKWTVTGVGINASGTTVGTPVYVKAGIQSGQAANINGAQIFVQRNDASRSILSNPYQVGEGVPSKCTVTNNNTSSATIVPTSANYLNLLPPAANNCRYVGLGANAQYTRTTPSHSVTLTDVQQGFFIPDTTWQVTVGSKVVTQRFLGDPVWLK